MPSGCSEIAWLNAATSPAAVGGNAMYFMCQPSAAAAGLSPSWKPWQTGWLQTRNTIVLPFGGAVFSGVVIGIVFGVPDTVCMYFFACAIVVLALTVVAEPVLEPT